MPTYFRLFNFRATPHMKHFPHVRQIFNFRIGKPELENLTGHGLYCLSALRELGKPAEQPPTVVDERSRAKAYGLSAISALFRFRNFGATCFSPLNFHTSGEYWWNRWKARVLPQESDNFSLQLILGEVEVKISMNLGG